MSKKVDSTIAFLQVVSAIAVVYLHCNTCFWSFSATERYWRTANVIESIFYFAVPIFFMISGITLLDYQERYTTVTFFKKRIKKTFIPFICWSMIGAVYNVITARVALQDLTLRYFINGFLGGNTIISIYWFFPTLFCIYLGIPLFAAVSKEKRKSIFIYILIVGFLVNVLIPFFRNVLGLDFAYSYHLDVIASYYMWPICGYVLYNWPPSPNIRRLIYIGGIVGLLMHTIGTEKLSIELGSVSTTYKGYNNVPCIMYSIAVFLMLVQISHHIMLKKKIESLIKIISQYTFSIYLIHYFVLQGIIGILKIDNRWIVFRLIGPFVIILIAITITWLLRKIPFLNKIVP